MKALIIVTVLAMATSAIAVPLSRQAKAQALLAAMQDNAKMEGWLRDIGGFLKKLDPTMLRDGLRLLNGGVVRVQTKSLDLQPEKPEGGVRSHSLGRVPDQSADSLDLSDENNNHFMFQMFRILTVLITFLTPMKFVKQRNWNFVAITTTTTTTMTKLL